MSVKIMARVWAQSTRKDGELLVMLALADFANDAGESWPSIPVLAQKARLTERQTRRVLIKLEQVGEIRKVGSNGGRNRRNHYFITLSENPDIITGKELQGKNNSVIGDTKTLTPMSGALNRHRTVNKNGASKKRSHPKDSDPRIQEIRDAWATLYLAHRGEKYHFTAKDFGLFKSALQTFDLPRLKELASQFFDKPDFWVTHRAGFTVGVFHSKLNALASTSAASWRPELKVMTV